MADENSFKGYLERLSRNRVETRLRLRKLLSELSDRSLQVPVELCLAVVHRRRVGLKRYAEAAGFDGIPFQVEWNGEKDLGTVRLLKPDLMLQAGPNGQKQWQFDGRMITGKTINAKGRGLRGPQAEYFPALRTFDPDEDKDTSLPYGDYWIPREQSPDYDFRNCLLDVLEQWQLASSGPSVSHTGNISSPLLKDVPRHDDIVRDALQYLFDHGCIEEPNRTTIRELYGRFVRAGKTNDDYRQFAKRLRKYRDAGYLQTRRARGKSFKSGSLPITGLPRLTEKSLHTICIKPHARPLAP